MTVTVFGLDEVEAVLDELVEKDAVNLLRSTTHAVAAEIGKRAKSNVRRETGQLRKSIKWRRRRSTNKWQPVSEVYFTRQGYYWRFVEHGTEGKRPTRARPFMNPARQAVFGEIDSITARLFTRQLERAAARKLKKQADAVKRRHRGI